MTVYTFVLRDGCGGIEDRSGVSLPDRSRALDYARGVVAELMRGRELQTRSWRLDVYENEEKLFELPFATLDRTLDHLSPQLRAAMEQNCLRQGSFKDAMHAARLTVRESRALVARSRGKPYLAAEFGAPIIR